MFLDELVKLAVYRQVDIDIHDSMVYRSKCHAGNATSLICPNPLYSSLNGQEKAVVAWSSSNNSRRQLLVGYSILSSWQTTLQVDDYAGDSLVHLYWATAQSLWRPTEHGLRSVLCGSGSWSSHVSGSICHSTGLYCLNSRPTSRTRRCLSQPLVSLIKFESLGNPRLHVRLCSIQTVTVFIKPKVEICCEVFRQSST